MNALIPLRPIVASIALLTIASTFVSMVRAEACSGDSEPVVVVVERQPPSWIFDRSTYTNDPATGARVAQYMRKPPVEPLPDPRLVTSRYRTTRTNLRGTNGSFETDYQVQAWGNGRGGLDAEWERFHDAWKDSFLSGSYYYGPGYGGYPPYGGYPGYGYGGPAYGTPGYGAPGYGQPGYGYPPHGFPHGRPDHRDRDKHKDRKDHRSFD